MEPRKSDEGTRLSVTLPQDYWDWLHDLRSKSKADQYAILMRIAQEGQKERDDEAFD